MDSVNCIDVAVQACECTQSELAKKIGVSSGQVSMWKKRGYITQKYLKKASEVTGLPAHLLNPFVPVGNKNDCNMPRS